MITAVPCFAQTLRKTDSDLSDLHNLFPTSRLYSKSFNTAVKLIREKKYSAGIPELQAILEAPEDYVSSEKDRNFLSLKRLAEQAIAELPEEGRRFYSLQYGPAAEQLFKQATAQDDIALLQEVVRRYFFTKAGAEAAEALGAYYFERGDFRAAIQQWESLGNQHNLTKSKELNLTFKQSVAWYHLGNLGKCRQALMQLARLTSGKTFEFPNGTKVTLFFKEENPVDWLTGLVGSLDLSAAQEQKNWTMYRGSPSRLSSAAFAVPSAKPVWRFSTIHDPARTDHAQGPRLEEMLQKLGKHRREHQEGVLPAASPLVINDKVIFRTHRNLKAVSLATGELKWETSISNALYQELLKDPQNRDEEFLGPPRTPLENFLAQRAWQDYTIGHLSTDGNLVYCVENVGFIAGFYHFSRLDSENILVPKSFNRLMAFELDSGKFAWELGGPRLQNAIDYSGHYFLGPPLALHGNLYCLAEEGREFRLLVLDAQTGKTLWTQSLFRSENPIARDYTTDRRPMDHVRRRMGLSPSAAHGVIVCQTGAGCTVGIDAVTRRLLWRNIDAGEEISPYSAFSRVTSQNEEGWAEFTPVIFDDRVLIYSRKLQNIQCLNLFDGRLLWSRPRRGNLFIASIHKGKILLVGNDQIDAIKTSDGSAAWPKACPIAGPSGRGIVVKNTYFQPVETGEILSIRLDDGLILARSRIETGSLPGNLAAAQGMLVSQNETEVVGFQSMDTIREQIRLADLSRKPEDLALSQLLRGELDLFSGNVDLAMKKIDQSIQIKPTLRAKRLYADMLLERLDHAFEQNQNQVSKMENLLVDDDQRKRFFQILALNYQRAGNLEAALQNYLRLSQLKNIFDAKKIKGGSFVRTDRWIRSQLELITARASTEERDQIRLFFSRYYSDHLKDANQETLERYLKCCGNLPETQQARVALVGKLEQAIQGSSINEQTELRRRLMPHLEDLRQAKQPVMAAFATAKLAQIYLGESQQLQAEELIQELVTRWPEVICMDGKTSLQLAQLWQSSPEFQKWQAAGANWPDFPAQVYRDEQSKGQNTSLPVEVVGLSNSFFDNYRFEVGPAKEYLLAFNGQGKQQWAFSLEQAEIDVPRQSSFSARVYQHFLVVDFGSHFFVLDTLNRDATNQPVLLWQQRLIAGPPSIHDYISIDRKGVAPALREYQTRNADRELLGRIGTINEEFICYQVADELIAAELLTGRILWKRQGITMSSWHFGDANHVIVMAPDERFGPRYVVLSGQSGEVLRSLKLDQGETAVFSFERYLLTLTPEADNTQRLLLRDLSNNREVWSHLLSESTTYTLGQSHEIAMINSEGMMSVLNLRTGETKFEIKANPLSNITKLLVLKNSRQYLFFVNLKYTVKNGISYRTLYSSYPFHGVIYSIDRKTGQMMWSLPLEAQGLDLSQFLDLPVLTFGIRKFKGMPSSAGTQIDLQIVDLRNGDIVFNETSRSNRMRIWVVPDVDQKNIVIEPFQIRLSYEEPPVAAKKP
ncbi:PQQ-binding-like beta-propeller repeat protein [uncultured Gimesia sp.]|uniref:outer membrane protein assembly factor BamB family protein n=1 Tax=uncultured Gimesia sp. TaxID=1678688 RepID=UPI0026068FC6|nr:PQQ-binding-like beta-propeller repeat protein [uncultured Gimesia sp.]